MRSSTESPSPPFIVYDQAIMRAPWRQRRRFCKRHKLRSIWASLSRKRARRPRSDRSLRVLEGAGLRRGNCAQGELAPRPLPPAARPDGESLAARRSECGRRAPARRPAERVPPGCWRPTGRHAHTRRWSRWWPAEWRRPLATTVVGIRGTAASRSGSPVTGCTLTGCPSPGATHTGQRIA